MAFPISRSGRLSWPVDYLADDVSNLDGFGQFEDQVPYDRPGRSDNDLYRQLDIRGYWIFLCIFLGIF